MEKLYNPYNINNYYIVEKEGKKYLKIHDHLLEINESGYIPKSGLLFDRALNYQNCGDKDVLDLGCGYLGIMGFIANQNKARQVDSIDYDINCVEWFNKLISDNNLSNINCFYSDYFSNVQDKEYDLILSNPPQMPMMEGSIHDSGGIDGRKYILQIMKESINYLKDNGSLYLLLFDFLGIDSRTSDDYSLTEISKKIGYRNFEQLDETDKYINKGVTYESLPHIKDVYPNYDYNQGKCKIKVVKFQK